MPYNQIFGTHEVEGPSKDMRFLGPTKNMRFQEEKQKMGPSKHIGFRRANKKWVHEST